MWTLEFERERKIQKFETHRNENFLCDKSMVSSSMYKSNGIILMLKSIDEVINIKSLDTKWRLWYIKIWKP